MKRLLSDFYSIEEIRMADGKAIAEISINPTHSIFEGHFPDRPVVPGVCMMQMVKEISEEVLSCSLHIALVQEMKFLAIIDPTKNSRVNITLTMTKNGAYDQVVAGISAGETIHFKFKGNFSRK